jgi:hypothetical protein
LSTEIAPKRLELLHELIPTTTVMALLVNPDRLAQTYAAKHRVKCCREKSSLVASFIAVKLPGEAMCND